jgi:hypothetical protein
MGINQSRIFMKRLIAAKTRNDNDIKNYHRGSQRIHRITQRRQLRIITRNKKRGTRNKEQGMRLEA